MGDSILAAIATALIWLMVAAGLGSMVGAALAAAGVHLVARRQTFILPQVWARAVILAATIVAVLSSLGMVRTAAILSLGDSWESGKPVLILPISRHRNESPWSAVARQTDMATTAAAHLRSQGVQRIAVAIAAGAAYDLVRGLKVLVEAWASGRPDRFSVSPWARARPGMVDMLVENAGIDMMIWLAGMGLLGLGMVASLLLLLDTQPPRGLPSGHGIP